MNELANFNVAVEFYAKNSPLPIPVNAQTGDSAILMYLIAFLIGLLVVMGLVFLVKKNAYATNVGKHQRIPESNNVNWHKPVIGVLIALICASVCVCCFTNNALTASAKSQHNGITTSKIEVAVDMQTQTIDDASFQLINDTEDYYIFDSKSTLEFTDEAKGIVSDPSSWNLVLNALNADLFKGAPDGTPYDIPSSVETFYPGQKADASLSFSKFNYDEVVKLIGKEVFVFTLIPNQHVVEIPTAIDNLTYNGTEQTGVEESTDGSYTLNEHKKINAGDYTAVATLGDKYTDYKWPDNTTEPKSINWSIARAKIAIPVAIEDLTYNKEQQTGVEEASFGEYTLSNYKATNAGDYDATATVTSNYMWNDGSIEDKTIPWSIARAKAQFSTPPTAVEVTYTGSNIALATAGLCDDEFEPVYKIEGSGSDFSTSIPTSIEIGKYTINSKAKVKTAHTQNYVDGDVINLESKINKINIVAKLDIPQGKSLEITYGETFDKTGIGVKGWNGDTALTDAEFKEIAGGESSLSPTYKQWDNCGDYPIQINLPSEEKWDPHYSITTEDKNLTVNKKSLTLKWSTYEFEPDPSGKVINIPYEIEGSYDAPHKATISYKTYTDKGRTKEKEFKDSGAYYLTAFLNDADYSSTNYTIQTGEKPDSYFEILNVLCSKAVLTYDVEANDATNCTLEFLYDRHTYEPDETKGILQAFEIKNIDISANDVPITPDWCKDEYAAVTKKIKIDESFNNCTKCSDTLTDLNKINYWFYKLKNVTSSEGFEYIKFDVTECTHMFDGCNNLLNLDLKTFDPSRVTDMSYMFSDMHEIKSFNIGTNFNTSQVTNMEYMFKNFSTNRKQGGSLTHLSLGNNFNTENVTNMSHMFYGDCMYSINFGSAWNTSNVVNMQSMFEECKGIYRKDDLDNILSNLNTSKVEDMSNMFKKAIDPTATQVKNYTFNLDTSHATNLAGFLSGAYFEDTLTLGDKFTAKNANTISGMFAECRWVTEIKFSNNFEITNVKDMSRMFEMEDAQLTKLINITWGEKFSTVNVENMSSMFATCDKLNDNLQTIISGFNTEKCTNMDSMFKNMTTLTSLDLSNFSTSNTENMGNMFFNCQNLKTLTLPDYFVNEKCKYTNAMFFRCSQLENFSFLQTFVTKSVIDMGEMFFRCEKLNNIVLPESFTADSATSISGMFAHCVNIKEFTFCDNFNAQNVKKLDIFYDGQYPYTRLTKLDLGNNFNAKSATDVKSLLSDQQSLKSIDFGKNFNASSAKDFSKLFWYCDNYSIEPLEKIDLGDNFNGAVAENMSYMFCNLVNLTDLSFNSLVTINAKDMNHMFSNLPKISHLSLPSGFNTSNAENMSYMFDNLPLIESIDVTDKCTAQNAINLSYMFNNLPKITTLKIYDNFNAVKATNMDYMFNNLPLVTSIDIGNSFNAKSLENVNTLFQSLPKLNTLKIGDGFNIESATQVKDMFKNISKLTTLTIGKDFNVSKAEDLSYMFSVLSYITELTIGDNFNAKSAKSMNSMFNKMDALTKLTLGTNFNTSSDVTMSSMFRSCQKLNSLNPGNMLITSGVTDTSEMFLYCLNLKTINNVENFNTKNVKNMSSMFAMCKLTDWTFINSLDTSSATNMENMFGDSSINVFPSNFDTRKVQSLASMFNNCMELKGTITLGNNFTAESATTTEAMFKWCEKITEINFCENFNSLGVLNMYRMFYQCYLLKNINFGTSFHTANVTDMQDMFFQCKALENIDLGPNFNTLRVTNMNGMFYECEKLGSINFGTLFDTSSVTGMSGMFKDCYYLDLTLPETFNTKNVKDMSYMFEDLHNTKNLIFPDVFNTENVESMAYMFYSTDCSSIKLPKNFTAFNATTFTWMFAESYRLNNIYCNYNLYEQAGEKLTSKGYTFYNCPGLPGYDGDKVDADMAKPQSEGGYFTTYSDESVNEAETKEQVNFLNLAYNNDENELLLTDLEDHADQAAIKEDAENEPTDDSKDIDDIAGAGVAGGAVIAPAVISQIMRRNKKNGEVEAF